MRWIAEPVARLPTSAPSIFQPRQPPLIEFGCPPSSFETIRNSGMHNHQRRENGGRNHKPKRRQDRLSENEKSHDDAHDARPQARVSNDAKLSLLTYRDLASFSQAALVIGQWIHNVPWLHNVRLTAVEQQEEPVRIPITDVFDLHSVPARDV